MPPAGDLYAALGLEKHATEAEVKRAYRTLAMSCHPDKNPDDPSAKEKFHAISEAYSTLSDPEKRAQYDGDHGELLDDLFMRVSLPQTQLRAVHTRLMLLPTPYLPARPCSGAFFKWAGLGNAVVRARLLPLMTRSSAVSTCSLGAAVPSVLEAAPQPRPPRNGKEKIAAHQRPARPATLRLLSPKAVQSAASRVAR